MSRSYKGLALALLLVPASAIAQYIEDTNWTKNAGGYWITIDPVNNDVWVASNTGAAPPLTSNIDGDWVIRCYPSSGSNQSWTWDGPGGSGLTGNGHDYVMDIVAYNGKAWVTGACQTGNPSLDPEAPVALTVARFNKSVTTGPDETWQLKDGSSVPIESQGRKVIYNSADDHVYVAGRYLTASQGHNVCLIKFEGDLDTLFSNQAGLPPAIRSYNGSLNADDVPIGLVGRNESGTYQLYVGAHIKKTSDSDQYGLIKWNASGTHQYTFDWGYTVPPPEGPLQTAADVPTGMVLDPTVSVIYMTGYVPQLSAGTDWGTIAIDISSASSASLDWSRIEVGTPLTTDDPHASIDGTGDKAMYIAVAARDSDGTRLISVTGVSYNGSNVREVRTVRYEPDGDESGSDDWYGSDSTPIGIRIDPFNLTTFVGVQPTTANLKPVLHELPYQTGGSPNTYGGTDFTPTALTILPRSGLKAWLYMAGVGRTVRWIPNP